MWEGWVTIVPDPFIMIASYYVNRKYPLRMTVLHSLKVQARCHDHISAVSTVKDKELNNTIIISCTLELNGR